MAKYPENKMANNNKRLVENVNITFNFGWN